MTEIPSHEKLRWAYVKTYLCRWKLKTVDRFTTTFTANVNIYFVGKQVKFYWNFDRRPIGSVGWASDYRAAGRGFEPRPDQHSGSDKDYKP